jgi:hypothetical protein
MTFALPLTMTSRGFQRFTDAQLGGDIDLRIAEIGFTDTAFVTAPTLTALPGQFRRIATISGEAVGDNVVHMIVSDDAAVRYQARGFGLFLADGTLFAVYGQADTIVEKAAAATLLFAIDIAFPTSEIAAITFGDANFLSPPATTERAGVVRLASLAEADAGVATAAVAPVSVLKAMLIALEERLSQAVTDLATAIGGALDGLAARTAYGSGLVKGGGRNDENRTFTVDAASREQIRAGSAGDVAVTPKGLGDSGVLYVVEAAEGYRALSDGTVEQWGLSPIRGTEGPFSLVFPRPFPNGCTGVFTTVVNNSGSVNGLTTIQEQSLEADRADLFVQNHQSTTNDAAGFRWRAWGR